jgi:origin recognition complex subunit 6
MPAIRALCKALKQPDAAPHVFAGVASVLKARQNEADTPSHKRKRKSSGNASPIAQTKIAKEEITPLVAVIAFYAISELDRAPEADEYIQQRKLAINTLAKFDPEGQRDENEITAQIENMMREAQNGWLDMDWYRNILKDEDMDAEDDELAFAIVESEILEDELADEGWFIPTSGSDKKQAHNDEDTVIRGGFGSMFNDSTDWLSEARKADYVHWKSQILLEIKKIRSEQSRGKRGQRSR